MSRLPPTAGATVLAPSLAPEAPLTLALLRIEASRARLRNAMMPPPDAAASDAGPGFALPKRWRAMWRAFTRSGPLASLASTAAGALGSWWRGQPWHSTTEWAGRAVLGEVQPLVRRHPLLAVALSAILGAALVSARPWRWRALNRQVRPLGGHLARWTLAQLSQVPVQMALAALLAQWVGDRGRSQGDKHAESAGDRTSAAAAPPTPPTPPAPPATATTPPITPLVPPTAPAASPPAHANAAL